MYKEEYVPTVEEQNEEDASFYEVVEGTQPRQNYVDRAEREIDEEDAEIAAGIAECKGDLDSDLVYLNFKKKMENAQFMSRHFRTCTEEVKAFDLCGNS